MHLNNTDNFKSHKKIYFSNNINDYFIQIDYFDKTGKKKYNNNETISLDIPISLQRKGEEPKLCNIQVYIKPNSKLERSRASYIRDCLIIDGEERWVVPYPTVLLGGLCACTR